MIKQEKAEQNRAAKIEQESQYFEKMFAELVQYKQQHGTTHVPKALNTPLSKWVISIKNMYRRLRTITTSQASNNNDNSSNGKSTTTTTTKNNGGGGGGIGVSILTAARIQRLHDLGFVFAMTEKQPYLKFHEWVERLRDFKKTHGHCRGTYVFLWLIYLGLEGVLIF